MLSFDIDLDGMEKMERETLQNARKVLFMSMVKMEQLAKRRVPVDTGRLRSSINLSPRRMGADEYVLADGVDYGVWVEYGTFSMIRAHGVHDPENPVRDWEAKRKRGGSGQTLPFFRPALLEVKKVWTPYYWYRYMNRD